MALDILLLGPQGSGKGTQAKRVAAEYGIPHVATGDMLRHAIALETPFGLRIKPILEAGDLVPDELVVGVIRERLLEDDATEGAIFDGFPRTQAQAEALEAMLAELGRKIDVVFDLQVAHEQVLIDRLLNRAVEEGRTDDTPEAIHRRLALYAKETKPLVEWYRTRHGNVVGVHADRSVNEVFSEIQQALDQVAVR
jgi:adenylate kinase